MRKQLAEQLTEVLLANGINSQEIHNDLIIVLNDYEITARETALAIRNEDKNAWYLKKFLIAKTVKGCTERTIRLYGKELPKILQAINKTVDEITTDDIRYYLAVRERRDGVTKTTVNNELRYLRSFFGWLTAEELLTRNPTAKLDAIKAPKKKKEAFSELDVERLRSGCRNAKETAIVEILLSTGCRVTELTLMKNEDINGNTVVVHGKGNKDRTVYLNAKAQIAIERYVNERNDHNPYLFPKMIQISRMQRNKLRNAYRYPENVEADGHTDKSSVEQLIRRLGKRSEVKGAHPHRFRRTCATFALRRGMPIEQVSKMLGHEQISTTQIYLDLDERDMEQAHRKYVV